MKAPTKAQLRQRIEALEYKIADAYQVVGCLLAGPDGLHADFSSSEGQRALDYFGTDEDYREDFLPFTHPRANQQVQS